MKNFRQAVPTWSQPIILILMYTLQMNFFHSTGSWRLTSKLLSTGWSASSTRILKDALRSKNKNAAHSSRSKVKIMRIAWWRLTRCLARIKSNFARTFTTVLTRIILPKGRISYSYTTIMSASQPLVKLAVKNTAMIHLDVMKLTMLKHFTTAMILTMWIKFYMQRINALLKHHQFLAQKNA